MMSHILSSIKSSRTVTVESMMPQPASRTLRRRLYSGATQFVAVGEPLYNQATTLYANIWQREIKNEMIRVYKFSEGEAEYGVNTVFNALLGNTKDGLTVAEQQLAQDLCRTWRYMGELPMESKTLLAEILPKSIDNHDVAQLFLGKDHFMWAKQFTDLAQQGLGQKQLANLLEYSNLDTEGEEALRNFFQHNIASFKGNGLLDHEMSLINDMELYVRYGQEFSETNKNKLVDMIDISDENVTFAGKFLGETSPQYVEWYAKTPEYIKYSELAEANGALDLEASLIKYTEDIEQQLAEIKSQNSELVNTNDEHVRNIIQLGREQQSTSQHLEHALREHGEMKVMTRDAVKAKGQAEINLEEKIAELECKDRELRAALEEANKWEGNWTETDANLTWYKEQHRVAQSDYTSAKQDLDNELRMSAKTERDFDATKAELKNTKNALSDQAEDLEQIKEQLAERLEEQREAIKDLTNEEANPILDQLYINIDADGQVTVAEQNLLDDIFEVLTDADTTELTEPSKTLLQELTGDQYDPLIDFFTRDDVIQVMTSPDTYTDPTPTLLCGFIPFGVFLLLGLIHYRSRIISFGKSLLNCAGNAKAMPMRQAMA